MENQNIESGQGLLSAIGSTLCRREDVPSKGRRLIGRQLRGECYLRNLGMASSPVCVRRDRGPFGLSWGRWLLAEEWKGLSFWLSVVS